jgi:hypothetical protein
MRSSQAFGFLARSSILSVWPQIRLSGSGAVVLQTLFQGSWQNTASKGAWGGLTSRHTVLASYFTEWIER